MRTARPLALIASVLSTTILLAHPASAGTDGEKQSPHLAAEVCEQMVVEAVQAVTAKPLPAPPVGKWIVVNERYECTYDLGGGSMVMRVDVERSRNAAKAAYRTERSKFEGREVLHGIGQASFQAPDGTLVARKDKFVLVVDPTLAPAGVSTRDVAFAAAVAVMSCWPG